MEREGVPKSLGAALARLSQRKNRIAFCLIVLGLVRLTIREALALWATYGIPFVAGGE
jgi:hypothetical protein